jgi:hypothetical protein
MIDVRSVVRQRRAHLIGMLACSHAYPCAVCAHRWFTPWIVSMFPLSRVIVRGNFPSTGVSRFIAIPVPVPLQSHHGNGFFYVARSYSGWHGSRVSLHARIAPLPLCGSMLSETPGARQPLSAHVHGRVACAQVNTLGSHPNFPVLGALCQIQSIHSSPRRTPTAKDSGSGRLDRPYPGRLLLCVDSWHTFLLSSGSEPG